MALTLLALWLGGTLPATAQVPGDYTAFWTGNGASTNANWSNIENWLPLPDANTYWAAPPFNPMTQGTPGDGWGDVDFTIDGYAHVDVPWTIGLLWFTAGMTNSFGLDGADLHLFQSTASTTAIGQSAVALQAGLGATDPRTVNITNNIFFDDSVFLATGGTTNYASAASASLIFGNNAAFALNFYGNLTLTNPAMELYVRGSSPVNFFGKVSAPTTNLYVDPVYGLNYAVVIASTGTGPGPVTFYNSGNTWSNLWFDLGTINLGIANALPTNSMVLFSTPSRTEILDLRGFDQTLLYISEGSTPTATHSITDSIGAGRLTLNDNGVTNDWTGIVMSGGASLVKNGNGTLIMEQNQTYTGPTTINAGVLQLGIGGTAGALASFTVTNNGTLIFNSTTASTLTDLYGSGGLQVLGSGGLSINGLYPYSGPTTIANGPLTLSANGVFSNSPSITLANSAASLNAMGGGGVLRSAGQSLAGSGTVQGDVLAAPGSTITVGTGIGTLTLSGNATFDSATINMELGADPSTIGGTVNDLISVTGGLTLANVSTVYVTPVAALNTATPYTLMQYGTLSGVAGNLNVILPSAGRYTFTVQDPASTAPYIKVGVKATLAGNLMWRGGNAVAPTRWDLGTTTNWLNGGLADRFLANDPVAFDDAALTNHVTLVGALHASSVVMSNNSAAYVFDGAGSVGASGALTVYGSGSLTLSNSAANGFSGGVLMEAGSLTVANPVAQSLGTVTLNNNSTLTLVNPAADTLGTVTLNGTSLLTVANNGVNTFGAINLASGTLAFNQPIDIDFGGVLTGGGTLVKQGASTLTLSGNNSAFTGAIQGNGGVLRVGNGAALNGSGVTMANNTTLDVNGIETTTHVPVTVIGNGVGGRGAIDNGSSIYQNYALDTLVLAGDATFGATVGGWEAFPHDTGAGGSITGNGFKLTKVGTNDLWLGSSGDTGLSDIEIKEGMLGFEVGRFGNCTMGDPTKTCTVRTNALLGVWADLTGDKQVVLDDGGGLVGGATGGVLGGPTGKVTLNGTNHVYWYANSSGYNFRCDSEMSGPGVLDVGAPIDNPLWGAINNRRGMLILGAANSFSQPVIVTSGTLRLVNPLALGTNGTVIVNTIPTSGSGVVVGPAVPRLELDGGVVIPPGVTVHLNSAGSNDLRTAFGVSTATSGNEYQGTLIPHGDSTVCLTVNNAASGLTISGQITNLDFVGSLNLRGAGACVLSGPIRMGGVLSHNPTGSGLFTVSSTVNQWADTVVSSSRLVVGAADALCVTAPLYINGGTLDLGGFNQTVPTLFSAGGTELGNSSTATDSVLTINGGTNTSTADGFIVDSVAGGARTVGLTITNTRVLLNAANTYTGPTLVQHGGTLGGSGSLLSAVTVQSGGTLAPGSSIGTLGITNTLTLNAGSTNVFEVDGGTLAHDEVAGLTSITYGGTLVVANVGATPLAAGQTFKLFDSTGGYSGGFAAIVPATPGPGLLWDTGSLAVDGTLKVMAGPHFTGITQVGSQNFQFTIAGPIGTNYSVRFSTNVTAPVATWQVLSSGTISTSPFTVNDNAATNAERFYRISMP
jgi:fibronectin-binding autotransporter adhesin